MTLIPEYNKGGNINEHFTSLGNKKDYSGWAIYFLSFMRSPFKIEKYQRKIDKLKGKIKNGDSNYDYSIDDVDDRPVIKRVEEDEYVMPKKSRKEKLKELEEAKKRLDKNKPNYRRLSLEDDDEL